MKSIYCLPGHGGRLDAGLGAELTSRGFDLAGRQTVGSFRDLTFSEQIDLVANDLQTSVHFPMRLSDCDFWTVEKRLPQGHIRLSLNALRALPAMKADQTDNFITNLCIQCRLMSAPASRGLMLRH